MLDYLSSKANKLKKWTYPVGHQITKRNSKLWNRRLKEKNLTQLDFSGLKKNEFPE